MKLTTGILLTTMMMTGAAWGQNSNIIQGTKDKLNAAEQQKVAKENDALGTSQSHASAKPGAKPSPAGAKAAPKPASAAVKPVASAAKPAAPAVKPAVAATKPAPKAEAKPLISVKPSAPASKLAEAKPAAPAVKPVSMASKPAPVAEKKQTTAQAPASKPAPTRIAVSPVTPQPKQGAPKTSSARKHAAKEPFAPQKAAREVPKAAPAAAPETAAKDGTTAETPKEKKMITAEGRRDPFLSPVVSRASGPACSVGKRCLAIDQIMVRGVVKSETGMIAVVVNSLNKAYFLKENDPVFNGYVLRITGDSVVFKETYQDRLGKELTREVVKKITTPAV
jgi:hypothetical protein